MVGMADLEVVVVHILVLELLAQEHLVKVMLVVQEMNLLLLEQVEVVLVQLEAMELQVKVEMAD
jgi:hypothetical protein